MGVDGSVYYSSCRDPLPYIFYKKSVNKTMNDSGTFDNDCVRCMPGYEFNLKAHGCLKLHSKPEVWEEAFVKCHNDGTVLASPLNKQLTDALRIEMLQFGVNGHIFLGTHDLNSKGNFASVEGVPLTDMDITLDPHGNRAGTGDCLTLSVDGSAYFSSCSEPLPFICFRKLLNLTINECGTCDNKYQLNQQTGSCYKIHKHKESWARAYGICASEGSHLVILNDEEEARIVKDMFPAGIRYSDNPWDGFHIGLRAWGKERIWTTILGEKIENVFNKWLPGEPNNMNGIQARAVYLWNGHLDDNNENNEFRNFACEISPIPKQIKDPSCDGEDC